MFGVGVASRCHITEDQYLQLQEKIDDEEDDGRSSLSNSQSADGTETAEARASTNDLRGFEWWRRSCHDQQRCVREALEEPESTRCGKYFHYFVVSSILVSVFCAVLVTVNDIRETWGHFFDVAELVFTAVFSFEILLRIWSAPTYKSYFCTCSNIIDLVATAPWYVEAICKLMAGPSTAHSESKMSGVAGSLRTLRIARLFRVVRLLKVARHSEVVSRITDSLVESISGVYVMIAFVSSGTVVAATLVYAVEQDVEGGQFNSLPISMWWALTTITTVGYGDMVPTTVGGRLVGALTMVGGTLIVTLSVAVVTSSFTEQYRNKTEQARIQKALLENKERMQNGDQDSPDSRACTTNLNMYMMNSRLNSAEEETKSVITMLRAEIELLQDKGNDRNELWSPSGSTMSRTNTNTKQPLLGAKRKAFPHHATMLLLDNLSSQADDFFKAMKELTQAAQIVDQEDQEVAALKKEEAVLVDTQAVTEGELVEESEVPEGSVRNMGLKVCCAT